MSTTMTMPMNDNLPAWVTPLAWALLASALLTAIAIAIDVLGRRPHGRSRTSDLVWITSALYLGPLAWVLYARHGRGAPTRGQGVAAEPTSPTTAALPGGSASAVAHLVGVPLVLASGLTIAGIDLWVMILVIGALAMVILYAYERAAAREQGRRLSSAAAAGLAVATVLAFDVGMGGWMVLLHFNELMPPATEATFWFLMQIGIVLGLLTGYPVASWLANRTERQTGSPVRSRRSTS
jgi:hypothetical protein